jgi:glycosyltransferase involved in cell wall biosynthesis
MCHAFQQIGIDVTLALPKKDCRPENREIIKYEQGIPFQFSIQEYSKHTLRGRPMSLGCYWGIQSILVKNKNIDYCFARDSFLARLSINRGFKTIYEVHDERLHPSEFLNKLYIKRLLKDVYSVNLVKFVAISQALADIWVKRGVPSQKILVLHDGVALDDYKTVKTRSQARLELGIKTKKKIVIYVGSLYEDRGIDNILRLAHSLPDATFLVVGGPEERKAIYESNALQQGLDNIIFVGRVPHYKVKDYLFSADVLLMLWSWSVPTINVCSPLKVFEYMAAERIIVGHGFSTIKEVLEDGETALLADPDSYHDLERKLRYALSLDYPNDMAQKARSIALNKYTWEIRAETIVKALQV